MPQRNTSFAISLASAAVSGSSAAVNGCQLSAKANWDNVHANSKLEKRVRVFFIFSSLLSRADLVVYIPEDQQLLQGLHLS
jgi:hypothetical protein